MDTVTTVYSGACPGRGLLDRIANKWTTIISRLLGAAEPPARLADRRRSIIGITQKMVTQTLRDLERDGLVVRDIYPVIPPRVEYSLTSLGHTLDEPLRALSE